ncbi:NAD-dependent epimerase/dehydratase family protein [Parasedimentitalea marina]|uniref:NAD-dependent epimerase/dehydratase family protein n=1 Tax=Parasedimentitalea marina TaxID=2483033 RepID=UPI001EE7C00B|nr:NAD-dependent epimerase/dehydratase family protein [Parasedimentitalea marina]
MLCLAGVVPGRGTDLADNTHLALAAIEAAAQAADRSGRDEGAARVFLASSAAVYGAGSGLLREEEPVRPTHAYGQAKRDMELQALARGRSWACRSVPCASAISPGWMLFWAAGDRDSLWIVFPTARARDAVISECAHWHRFWQPCCGPASAAHRQSGAAGDDRHGDLLRAAGREFALQPASERAIPEVAFDLTLLQKALSQKICLPQRMPLVWQGNGPY